MLEKIIRGGKINRNGTLLTKSHQFHIFLFLLIARRGRELKYSTKRLIQVAADCSLNNQIGEKQVRYIEIKTSNTRKREHFEVQVHSEREFVFEEYVYLGVLINNKVEKKPPLRGSIHVLRR